MSNQECKVTPEVIDINSNEPLLYPYSVFVNNCSGSCNNTNDNINNINNINVIKNIDVKVFNLMSRTNETHIKWHENCKW